MDRLLQTLYQDKTPLILTVFLAAVGWAFTRYVDRIAEAPIIEYRLLVSHVNDSSRLTVPIENLTSSKRFENLIVIFRLPPESSQIIKNVAIEPKEPAWEGNRSPSIKGKNSKSAEVPIELIQPGWRYVITLEYTGSQRPSIQLFESSPSRVGGNGSPKKAVANQPVSFVERSLRTSVMRYEVFVVAGLLTLWLIAMIAFAHGLPRRPKPRQARSRQRRLVPANLRRRRATASRRGK